MRKFIRHPSDIPIDLVHEEGGAGRTEHLKNVSRGGIAVSAGIPQQAGSMLRLRIPHLRPPFETLGRVVWCHRGINHFDIGIEILNAEDEFRARMVEQVCHIERYKKEVLSREGRILSGEEAASEWINQYATEFPQFE
jgi:hypothetical protein